MNRLALGPWPCPGVDIVSTRASRVGMNKINYSRLDYITLLMRLFSHDSSVSAKMKWEASRPSVLWCKAAQRFAQYVLRIRGQ